MHTAQRLFESLQVEGVRIAGLRVCRHLAQESSIAGVVPLEFRERYDEQLSCSHKFGYWPHVKNPRTFNEKVLHPKFFTDAQRFARLADKWRVRSYVRQRVGEDILNKVYHVTDDPDTSLFESLPDRFVVNRLTAGTTSSSSRTRRLPRSRPSATSAGSSSRNSTARRRTSTGTPR